MAKISTYEDDASVLGSDKVIGTDAVDGSTKNYTMDGIAAYAALQASVGDMSKATYDPSNIEEQLIGVSAAQSLTNKSVNGVVLSDAGLSSSFLSETGDYTTIESQPSSAVLISAKVDEAGGVTAGQVVYISGATGGFPQVALADNTDYSKANVLAISTESKADGQTVLVCISGLIEDIDTSAFTEGDTLYLGTNGNLTSTHPSGINAVQVIGFATKINASTGSVIMELDTLTVISNYNGIVRHQLINQSAGNASSSAYTLVNNASHRASISMVGSNYSAVAGIAESMVIYSEGYNKTVNANDGNFGFEWWTDETDSHNLSSTAKMTLTSSGDLSISKGITHKALISTPTISSAGNYTILITDYVILKDGITGGGDTVTLPNDATNGQMFLIKDSSGTANTNNITINTADTETIDGSAEVIINGNYDSVKVIFDGTNYSII
tara:strand:- start:43276 stop:44598 length:1323 start_codon:yes stop_codon:yes gene_type:complete